MRRRRRRNTRLVGHWCALGAAFIVLAVALGLHGYTRQASGGGTTRNPDVSPGAPSLSAAGPILDLSESPPRSTNVPRKTIALTFDDGPDPRGTPHILDVLARHGVPATFFVTGIHVTRHPEIVRRTIAEGHEVGNHTFTHIDLASAPEWQRDLELRLTEVALAAATGHHSRLFRPPYSSRPSSVRVDTLRAWQRTIEGRHLVVLSTLDSRDWEENRTAEDIRQASLPTGEDGGIVLMHDGGGDRRATIAALDDVIRDLKRRGYEFATISQVANLSRAEAMPSVDASQRIQSKALPLLLRVSHWLTVTLGALALAAAILVVLRSVVLLAFARRHAARTTPDNASFSPSVSIVLPAYNEEQGVEASVRSLATSRYEDFEVIVVDDGSTDRTLERVQSLVAREHFSNVRVVHQPNSGKADALNRGIEHATGEIIVTVDGDSTFAPDTLALLLQPFRDSGVGAVSGNTKVANRHGVIGRWQHVEYVMSFNLDRRMYDRLACMPTVPGAIGAFRAAALADVGGFRNDTLAEDTEVTMALLRAGWRVTYAPSAVAWTEAPSRLRDLWRQRYRWSYGTMQSVWKHRRAVIEPGSGGRLGRIGLPYLVGFQIALPLLGPATDLFALYGFLFLDRKLFAVFWLSFTALQAGITAYALRLDRESLRPLWVVPLQQFVYRQMMYLVLLQALAAAMAGARLRWHKLRRSGAVTAVPASMEPTPHA